MKSIVEDRKNYVKRTLKCVSNKMSEDYIEIGQIYNSEYDFIWDTYAIKINGEVILFKNNMFEKIS